jgi:uncharacterized protein (DUF924 family)
MATAADVLAFWFADSLTSAEGLARQYRRWFRQNDAFDAEIAARFASLPEDAAQGQLNAWRSRPDTTTALVLVLDQFPRSLYRNSSRAFAFDAKALAEAEAAIARGDDDAAHPLQAAFLYMPFQHAETIAAQQRSVDLYRRLRARAPADLADKFEGFVDYAQRHLDVVDKFGRFPHRNALLGRKPTAAEQAYLAEGGETFGVRQSDA